MFLTFLFTDPVSLVRDHKIKTQLTDCGITVQSFNGDLLNEPWEVYDDGGLAFTTFEPYWEKCTRLPIEPTLFLPPWKLVPPTGKASLETLRPFFGYRSIECHACIYYQLKL